MRTRALFAVAAVVLGMTGCGKQEGASVRLDEYTVQADPGDQPAGAVTIHIRNVGQIRHQLVILQTARDPGDLPVRDAKVRTRGPGIHLVRSTPRIAAGGTRTLTVRLRPGPYVLICNVPGHYQSGMHTAFHAT